jgi:hypothetical protein
VSRALLVANEDVLQAWEFVQVLVDGQVGAAWVAEDVFDTFALQRFEDHFGSGHFLAGSLQNWAEKEEAPTFRSGAFAIFLVV